VERKKEESRKGAGEKTLKTSRSSEKSGMLLTQEYGVKKGHAHISQLEKRREGSEQIESGRGRSSKGEESEIRGGPDIFENNQLGTRGAGGGAGGRASKQDGEVRYRGQGGEWSSALGRKNRKFIPREKRLLVI